MSTQNSPAIRPPDMILRCFAQRERDQWVSVCVDLNLAAQADSFDESRRKLHEQIGWYVYDALAGDDKDCGENWLQRKAPLPLMVKYHLIACIVKMRSLRSSFRLFCDTLPLAPNIPATA